MQLKEVAPPDLAPVLSEFSAHLRLGFGFADSGAENALLEQYLETAVAAIETRTAQALLTRDFVLRLTGWDRRGYLALPVGPVASIDRIRFVLSGGDVALDPGQWTLAPGTSRQLLTGPAGDALPPPPSGAMIELDFTAGHAPAWTGIPAELRQAVLMLAAHYHEGRYGDTGNGIPPSVAALLAPHQPARL